MRGFNGKVWRHVPVGAEPLHLGWILKANRGRWNSRRPRLPCLYTSLTKEGAIAEFEKHVTEYGAPRHRDVVSLLVKVTPVADLTETDFMQRYRLTSAHLTGDSRQALIACRAIARQLILDEGYQAILAPSAALGGATNLMIYIEVTSGIREISNGPDREPVPAAAR